MKFIALLLVAVLSGCSLNSVRIDNRKSSDLVKPCCCSGETKCQVDESGVPCCSPERCGCQQITSTPQKYCDESIPYPARKDLGR